MNQALSDYSRSDHDPLDEDAEFGYSYKFFKLFRTCLHLTSSNQYRRARKTFYDSLGWFSTMFDSTFVDRSDAIVKKYDTKDHKVQYTYEQLEEIKYMRIVTEFTRMLIDASSKNRVKLNTQPEKRVELVPIGYGQVVNYEQLSVELFNKLHQVQKYAHPRDIAKFFNHSISWFGGIFDATFVLQGYLIQQQELSSDLRYRKLLIAFNKMLARKSIIVAPMASLVYKPSWTPPYTVEDVVRGKQSINEVKAEWEPDFTITRSIS